MPILIGVAELAASVPPVRAAATAAPIIRAPAAPGSLRRVLAPDPANRLSMGSSSEKAGCCGPSSRIAEEKSRIDYLPIAGCVEPVWQARVALRADAGRPLKPGWA